MATKSLLNARMRAQFEALDRRVTGAAAGPPLRAALDGFATQFSPLLNEAIADERRDRDAAAASVAALRDRMTWTALGAGLTAALLTVLFYLVLVKPMIARINRIGDAADTIGRGDFEVALRVDRRDEIGRLFAEVTRMAGRLKARRDAVDADRARLNELISERTAELSDANERLSMIDADRRRFFADLGHELRTPLTVIMAESELSASESADRDEALAALAIIRTRASRLNRRLNDLLRVARSETGRIELDAHPFDMAAAAEAAAADMARLADRKGVTLHTELAPTPAHGDPDWCRQVVSGLIDNAIRHSPNSGRVEITCQPVNGKAQLTVSDQGPGVAPDQVETVFERFVRGGREASGSGFGVGLALARWVVEHQNGEIRLESPASPPEATDAASHVGPGAKLVMMLPATASPQGGAPDDSLETADRA
jgi:signal transduction histidine kinase